MSLKKRNQQKTIEQPAADSTAEQRYDYALNAAELLIESYQAETTKYSNLNIIFTTITLVGSALTPLLILLVPKETYVYRNFWVALPSAVAGLAAAMSSALRFKDEWASNYFTLSALDNERDRLVARSSPEYSTDKELSQIVDNFFNRVGLLVMSEVTTWRQAMTHAGK